MKRPVFFCKSWFRAKKRPTEVWTEAQAKAAHGRKQYYTALLDSTERPYCFLEVTEKAVGVSFLDDHLRESLSYAFQEVEPDRLFLTMATYREFEKKSDRVVSGTSYIFGRNGEVQIRREHFNPHSVEVANTTADVVHNYTDFPKFGEYDDLIRVERG
ncbi:hypothetical protein [Andreprevotia chitinilytica]|uniref:hypothetical protein n=1 Tax=Andreprevotia chitinilytica TaxID=396808 RepID=UPI00054F10B3|nr:hypothetical protein [Andreprevotia chitinilytica]